jgi:16S rRNA (guanine966-N2)-methyltransferase
LPGAQVLDLFAGSGALGIEALSRGARHVEFTDVEPAALRAIAENLEGLGADPATWRIRRGDAWRRLARLEQDVPDGAVVLLDPPYAPDVLDRCLPAGAGAIESGRITVLAVEHAADAPEPGAMPAGVQARRRRHGHGAFTLLTRSDP